jgi:hypothetical protein
LWTWKESEIIRPNLKKTNETGKTAENKKVDQERDFPNELIGSLEPGAYPTSPLQVSIFIWHLPLRQSVPLLYTL